jgi:hypothetical protein
VTSKLPVVSVPVLSRTTVSMWRRLRGTLVFLIMMPRRAAAAKAATMALGLESSSAAGHVTMSTVRACSTASSRAPWRRRWLLMNQTMLATDEGDGHEVAATCSIRSWRGERALSASRMRGDLADGGVLADDW